MPHGLNTYVNKRFCQILSDSTRDVAVQQSSMPLIENYEVPKVKKPNLTVPEGTEQQAHPGMGQRGL